MKAIIRHVEGQTFVAKSDSNHWVALDSTLSAGGSEAANTPVQLLLIACGGCTGIDVVNILRKGRKQLEQLRIEVEAARREESPQIIRALDVHVVADGEDLNADVVRRALELSLTKYCSVSLSLDRSVRITARVTVNGEAGEPWPINRDTAIYE